MANAEFRIFLSAVSSEFRSARNELTDDFGARDVLVRVQEQFAPGRRLHTLLAALDEYIRGCTTVICVIGRRSGACPMPEEAAAFAGMLPDGVAQASYTQWEYFLARHHGKECLLFLAQDAYEPDEATPHGDDFPDLQRDFVERIKRSGLHYVGFATTDALCRAVGRHRWPERTTTPSPATQKPIVLPYPSLRTLFKGRDAFLRRLHSSLTRLNGGATAICAVAGMGGVGKSRAAVEYARAYRAEYTALLWLEADTGEKLQAGLAALVAPLRLAEHTAAEQVVRVEAVLAWLNANPGWLLILDNVDSRPAVEAADRLMGRIEGGRVLLTSRLTEFPLSMGPLDLGVLALPDAVALLLEGSAAGRPPAPDDAPQAEALAEELGKLALALIMAAATMRARRFSFAQYCAVWQDNRARVIGWARSEIPGYHHAVAETWRTSVDQLTEPGRRLLERLAFLAPDPVPEFLLDVPVPGVAPEDAHAALDDLATYSLATRDPDGGTYLVHRLVQDVTRRGLGEAGMTTQLLTETLCWVNDAFTGNPQDVRTWGRLDPLVPHADAVAAHADAAGIANPTGQLMNQLGVLLNAKALYARAEPMLRRGLAITENSLGKGHPDVAPALNNLATLLQDTNRRAEAEPLLRRALVIAEASLGKDHPNVATSLNNLAQLLKDTNRLAAAEPLMRRALTIDEAFLGKDHPDVARDLNNLAMLLLRTNRLDEAEPLIHRALAIAEARLGEHHPYVGTTLSNLAQLFQRTNRPLEAEPLLRRALAITEESFGKDHPNVATVLNNLAQLLQRTNRHGEAEPLMRRALVITEAIHGKDHPHVATSLNNLAMLLRASNQHGEAEPLLRRALAIDEVNLGKDHPDVVRDLNNIALVLHETGRFSEAVPLMRRHLAIFLAFQRDTGHAHPHRDAAIGNYSVLLRTMGRSDTEIGAAITALWLEVGLKAS